MPAPKPADVDSYLAGLPVEVRTSLVAVRAAMRRALPTAVEAIKYGMPAYVVDGRAVASFAGWKTHYALYIVAPALFETIAKDLDGREASKGIIRFELDESVPESVFERLGAWSVSDAASSKATTKKATTKKPTTKKATTKKPTTKKATTKKAPAKKKVPTKRAGQRARR